MKTRTVIKRFLLGTGIFMLFAFQTGASATTMSFSLGNTSPGFSDGEIPLTFLVGGAQGGQPAPFDQGYGTDVLLDGNFIADWMFSFAPIIDVIISANISFGIVDHDTSASGSQLESFLVEGTDLTASLDTMFEAGGGSLDGEYNVYTMDLGAGLFSDLSDGLVGIHLALQGPGLVTPLFPLPGPNPIEETTTNGANLIFSTLTIETTPIPEPGSLVLTFLGLSVMGLLQRRGQRSGF